MTNNFSGMGNAGITSARMEDQPMNAAKAYNMEAALRHKAEEKLNKIVNILDKYSNFIYCSKSIEFFDEIEKILKENK